MIYEALVILKYLPKVTLSYVAVAALYGISTNNILLAVTIMMDLLDYIPI